MSKFSVDLNNVATSLSKTSFKFSEVSHKFEKVAFDVYRKKDGNFDELWQIQHADDGNEYIVALYNEEEKIATASAPCNWSVVVKNEDLHVFYKQEHLAKLAASDLGFRGDDLALVKRYLPAKLADSKDLVKSLLKNVNQQTLQRILFKYPELA